MILDARDGPATAPDQLLPGGNLAEHFIPGKNRIIGQSLAIIPFDPESGRCATTATNIEKDSPIPVSNGVVGNDLER